MCLPSILVERLSSDEKTVLMLKKDGQGFGTGTAPINVIKALQGINMVQRMGYDPRWGRASWVLTHCGRRAGNLLLEIEANPLLRPFVEDTYDDERSSCPYLS
jgi:hypothetical protein